ncbi:MAG: hypothetical protein ACTSUQ_04595 [Candidatus Freyarchaeota archaeon]
MKKCELTESESLEYATLQDAPEIPMLDVTITRPDMKESIRTKAVIDTGFDEAMLLSREVRDELVRRGITPDDYDSLDAGAYELPCEVYSLQVKVSDEWFRIRSYHPVVGEYETLVGRTLINKLIICLRGTEKRVVIAKK